MKRANLLFSTLRSRTDEYKTKLIQDFSDNCLQGFVNGDLNPIIDKVFNMSEAAKAHEYMESNATIGKVLLKNDL